MANYFAEMISLSKFLPWNMNYRIQSNQYIFTTHPPILLIVILLLLLLYSSSCYTLLHLVSCDNEFYRKFGTKCAGCQQGILPSDFVRRARSKVFHLNCFKCSACRKQLDTGEELYILDENRFICKEDFLSSRHHHGKFVPINQPVNQCTRPPYANNIFLFISCSATWWQ